MGIPWIVGLTPPLEVPVGVFEPWIVEVWLIVGLEPPLELCVGMILWLIVGIFHPWSWHRVFAHLEGCGCGLLKNGGQLL